MRLTITREGLIGRIVGGYAEALARMPNHRLFREYCRIFWRCRADEVEFVDVEQKKQKKRLFRSYKYAKRGI